MDKTVLQFLKEHRISVLSVLKPDGSPHTATLHVAFSEDPLSFFNITEKTSKKCEGLLDGKSHKAAMVIGFSEEEFQTLQMEGDIKIVTAEKELEHAWNTYTERFPTRKNRRTDSDFVILQFTPTWAVYSDYKADPIKKITVK